MREQAKSIFILKSALSSEIHLELTYSNPCLAAETNVGPQAPGPPGSPSTSEEEIHESLQDDHG
jgi:hypothetical protein